MLVPHRQELCSRGLHGADWVPTAEHDLLLEEGELLGYKAEGMRAGQVVPVATVFLYSQRLQEKVKNSRAEAARATTETWGQGAGWPGLALPRAPGPGPAVQAGRETVRPVGLLE